MAAARGRVPCCELRAGRERSTSQEPAEAVPTPARAIVLRPCLEIHLIQERKTSEDRVKGKSQLSREMWSQCNWRCMGMPSDEVDFKLRGRINYFLGKSKMGEIYCLCTSVKWEGSVFPSVLFTGRVRNKTALQSRYILQHNSPKMALGRNHLIHIVSLFFYAFSMKGPMLNCLYSVNINTSNGKERIEIDFHLKKLKSFNIMPNEIVVVNHCVTERKRMNVWFIEDPAYDSWQTKQMQFYWMKEFSTGLNCYAFYLAQKLNETCSKNGYYVK